MPRIPAFSYGVLEALRDINVVAPSGKQPRLLDAVGVITGVSGGSFTALAYGLYGDKLFDVYETSFLKHDVQGELLGRALNPLYWGPLSTEGWVHSSAMIAPRRMLGFREPARVCGAGHLAPDGSHANRIKAASPKQQLRRMHQNRRDSKGGR